MTSAGILFVKVGVLTFSRSVPVACCLAASSADSLCGWIILNSDTRLTASWSLEKNTTKIMGVSHGFIFYICPYFFNWSLKIL